MNFNVYVDKRTGEQLAKLAKRRRTTRNALIREAVARLLDEAATPRWPAAVMKFTGDRRAPRFEEHRDELSQSDEDPLA